MKASKAKTIDECCGVPEGSFKKFLDEQEKLAFQMEEDRKRRIREFLKKKREQDNGGS